jgi:multicomponent Na+:H+ antiporter subunit G
MEYLSEIFSWIFILMGSLLILIGSIGLIRLPDFWSRLHGASITDTGGVLFLLIGMMIQAGSIWIFLKLVAIGIFLFVSSPTASHAIANAAYVTFGYNSKREAKK